jgi:hypothetical protein
MLYSPYSETNASVTGGIDQLYVNECTSSASTMYDSYDSYARVWSEENLYLVNNWVNYKKAGGWIKSIESKIYKNNTLTYGTSTGTYGDEIYSGWKIKPDGWANAACTMTTDEWCQTHRAPPLDPRERLRQIMRDRHCPAIHMNPSHLVPGDSRETKARETLRMIVGEEQFRCFVKRGFVTARGKSGKIYQVFHKSNHLTYIWENGQCIERLCIYLKGSFPPTDFVITLFLMILNNEERVWQVGIKNGPGRRRQTKQELLNLESDLGLPALIEEAKITGPRPLAEIYADLKEGKSSIAA